MPDLVEIDEARERVLAAVRPLPPDELPLAEALGRVLAEDLVSDQDLPPFDSSAMDGYALVAGEAGDLPVVAEARAGHPAERGLGTGEAIAISTGARLPAGADAVVPIERAERLDGDRVRLPAARPGANVRRAGEDVRAGETVVGAGTLLGPAELAVAAAAGRARLRCGGRPRVAVLATGDELVAPGEPLGAGQIRNSNAVALAAQVRRAGGTLVGDEIVPDDREATLAALARALERADVVCVSGGVSVGEHDHVRPALARLGVEERFWGVRLKPGKPVWFGARGDRLVFGLPGNPVSAIVTFHLFARPALRRLAGADPDETRARVVLDEPIARSHERVQLIRCRLRAADDGWHAEPTKEQGSHVLSSMVGAGALAVVPAGEGTVAAGERVEAELLESW